MYGQDAQTQRVTKLVDKKAQLEAALPMVDDARAMQIESRLDKIEAQLMRELAKAQQAGNQAAIQAAMGSLEFQVQAPPGQGRLLRLPFYPDAGATGYVTGAGGADASTTVPTVGAQIPQSYGTQLGSFQMKTPQISWATLRIVGFEVDVHNTQTSAPSLATSGGFAAADNIALHSANAVSAPKVIVKDLQVGGGATLFTHEEFADAVIYDASQPEFCGLRDYPILKSPNQAQVQVAAVGCGGVNGAGGGAPSNGIQSMVFSCTLLCEVLQDDVFGSHVPGPYARGAALARRGGSFIS